MTHDDEKELRQAQLWRGETLPAAGALPIAGAGLLTLNATLVHDGAVPAPRANAVLRLTLDGAPHGRRGDLIAATHGAALAPPLGRALEIDDAPIASFFDASDDRVMAPQRAIDARYAGGLAPLDAAPDTSAVFAFPFARTREGIDALRRANAGDPWHGVAQRFADPRDGSWVTPTLGAWLLALNQGFAGAPYRASDATLFVCLEGCGKTHIFAPGGRPATVAWRAGDIFAVPSWHWRRHEADDAAILFAASDRPAQEKLGLWREAKGNA